MKIEVGEYVRYTGGYIDIVCEIVPADYNETDYAEKHIKGKRNSFITYDRIQKHSKNIIDLIEVGDILQIEISEEYINKEDAIRFIMLGQTYTIKEIKEALENGMYKIQSIVTKEQFANIQYKVEKVEE